MSISRELTTITARCASTTTPDARAHPRPAMVVSDVILLELILLVLDIRWPVDDALLGA